MRAIAAGVTDVGREREHNEDRYVLLSEFRVFVVADGMGGHERGEVASRLAVLSVASHFRASRGELSADEPVADELRDAIVVANRRIFDRGAEASAAHMGTTIVALAVDGEAVHIGHAGDSRCYRFRQGVLERLTTDHSLVEDALRAHPDMTADELAYLPANVITRALGVEEEVTVDVTTTDGEDGDLFLLCSDGLHGFVPDERIAEILKPRAAVTDLCAELVQQANENGGGDNITAVLVRLEHGNEHWSDQTSIPPPPSQRVIRTKISVVPQAPAVPKDMIDEVVVNPNDITERVEALSVEDAAAALSADDDE